MIDFKNPSFEQIWADAVNIVPEDFDPLTWLLTFLTFDVAIVVVIVMDGKSRIKGTIELCSSRFGHASWRMPVEFLPRKSESHS